MSYVVRDDKKVRWLALGGYKFSGAGGVQAEYG
jgi:hypothetical protein